MKSIRQILEELGLEQDKLDELVKAVESNYKTVAEYDKLRGKLESAEKQAELVSERDKSIADLQKQLEAAGEDSTKLAELSDTIEALTKAGEEAKAKYEADLAGMQYDHTAAGLVNGLEFSSESAKRAFLHDLKSKELKLDGDKLLGFDDFLKAYKESDAGAFVTKEAESAVAEAAKFAAPANGASAGADGADAFGFNFNKLR